MNIMLRSALAATALAVAAPAVAAPLFTINSNSGVRSAAQNGNHYSFTATSEGRTLQVKATAWTMGYDRSTLTASRIQNFWNDGLGVYQPDEEDRAGYHQVDNVKGWEFIVLQFDQQVSLQTATLNTFQLADRDYKDNDAFVAWGDMADIGGSWDRGLDSRDLKWAGSFNSNSDDYSSARQTYTSQVGNGRGNLWVIGGSVDGPDWRNDAFKLAQLQVAAVPEPTTWAMMLGGFAMVGAGLRRRNRTLVIA